MLIDYWRFAKAHPRFLSFGFFMAFLSSAGQTYFIGVFGPEIQSEFNLDPGSWGRTYMVGTLMSALVINWTGSLIDKFDLRLFSTVSILGLCIACIAISQANSLMFLIFAIFLLRQFGQGLTSHTGITSMARYHDVDRGKAIALAAIGFAFGEALFPVLGLMGSQAFGWRLTFLIMSGIVFLSIFISLWLLKGHKQRHLNHTEKLQQSEDSGTSQFSYSRWQVVTEKRFYFMLPAMIAIPMIGTALFFFPAEIAAAKGWTTFWVTGNYWLYSLVSVATTIYSGVLIDRFTAKRVVPLFLLPLAVALIVLNISDSAYLVWPYMILMGVTTGLYFTGLSALWAELYGPKFLGAIKSFTNAVMVFSSALGPAFVGTLLEWQVVFSTITLILAGMSIFATVLLVIALRLPARQF